MALLKVRGLEKWYGRRQVVCGVDYEVERGEVVGLLGPNGAGKTTSFRMTIGLIDADGGSVHFDTGGVVPVAPVAPFGSDAALGDAGALPPPPDRRFREPPRAARRRAFCPSCYEPLNITDVTVTGIVIDLPFASPTDIVQYVVGFPAL